MAVYAYDQRGYGRSPGRGLWAGEQLLTEDLRTVVALVRARYPKGEIIAVAGTSMGGSVAIEAFASDRPPAADRLLPVRPGGKPGWSNRPGGLSGQRLDGRPRRVPGGRFTLPGWVLSARLGSVRQRGGRLAAAARSSDDLGACGRTALMALPAWPNAPPPTPANCTSPQSTSMARRIDDRALAATESAAGRLPAGDRTAVYAEGWHLLLLDREAMRPMEDVLAFLRDPAAPLPSGAPSIPRPK